MARKPAPVGPCALRLIEDAPVDLVRAVLAANEANNESDLCPPPPIVEQSDEDAREAILVSLARFDQEELHPLEVRCRRIIALSEAKGASSLDTVVEQHLGDEDHDGYEGQPDSLCRSIWTWLKFHEVFEDAESFHFARRYREIGKLYDALEVDLDEAVPVDAASTRPELLAKRITLVLGLKKQCTVRVLDLPPTSAHPQSVMLIVRHGGPLSSVVDHRDDGRRKPLYYRPPNEATLIYTPANRQIEICADSPVVRQKISGCFAEVVLGHDVSRKPLTWKRYDLSRFRFSLTLPLPDIDGFDLLDARVLEIEIRPGDWRRKLALKVTIDDNIEQVAKQYLGGNNVLLRADGFSRIALAVRYHRKGDTRKHTLGIIVSGSNSCNLQSLKDPEARSLGYALLAAWGVMSAFRQIEKPELQGMFSRLLALFDRASEEVTGRYLKELGLDPARLIEGGLLERRGRQEIVLLDERDDAEAEVSIGPSSASGMVRATGSFGEDLGDRPAADLEVYRLNQQWLHESLVGLIRPLLSVRALQILDTDLTLLGSMKIDGGEVPVYFARRLADRKVLGRLDLLLRGRSNSGFGIVLAAGTDMPACLGANVVVPLASCLSEDIGHPVVSRDGLELAFRSGRNLAMGGTTPVVHRYASQSATLYVPGKTPLSLVGANQIRLFECLVEAHLAGSPDVKASTLTEGTGTRSPQHCFRPSMWRDILDVYLTKGVRKGYWRLAV